MSQKIFKIILAITISIVFLIRLFYSLPNAPTLDTDAIFSVEAARSITEIGIPIGMNTGKIYERDYIAYYLLAGSILLFGDNMLGYILPSIIFSIIVLILIYFISKTITNNKIIIFLSIFFVSISLIENTYAINPRPYMGFQFFFLLTIFFFYKGFVEKNKQNKKYAISTIFLLIVTVLFHAGGLILFPVFSIYIIIKNKKWYKDKIIIYFFLITTIASAIFLFINPSKIPGAILYSLGLINNDLYEGPLNVSIDLSSYFDTLFLYLPFFSIFIFVGTFFAIKNKKDNELYFYYIFWTSLLVISVLTHGGSIKYIFCLFPLFTILSFVGVNNFIEFFTKKNIRDGDKKLKKFLWLLLVVFFTIFPFYTSSHYYGFTSFFVNHKEAISYISENKKGGDIIICTDPPVYIFYLNQCDYYLRQKRTVLKNNEIIWSDLSLQYKASQKLNYIDSLEKLKNILNNNDRTWLAINKNDFSLKIEKYILKNTKLKYKNLKEASKIDYDIFIFLHEKK